MSGSHLIHRGWPPHHPLAVSATGATLRLEDGREILDAAGGAAAVTLGYSDPEIVAAMADQASRLSYAHSGHFTNEAAEGLASDLAEVMPGSPEARIARFLFVAGGSEAIELAVALAHRIHVARGEPDRRLVIARHLSYHGSSAAALGLGARRSLQALAPGIPPVAHIPPPYPYRPEWTGRFPDDVAGVTGLSSLLDRPLGAEASRRGQGDPAAALEASIEALGTARVSAFLAEPVIGASAGAVVPDPDYWPRVREICDRHGVLLIADEVMTGMARTGAWLACEHWGIAPDLVALGKGLGSGYAPLAAVGTRESHWQAVAAQPPGFPFGFTFNHHPLAAAAGRAVPKAVRDRGLLDRAARLHAILRERLDHTLSEHPRCGDLRGIGALLGIEIVADRGTRRAYPRSTDATGIALRAAEATGVVFYPVRGCADGVDGDGLLVAPPLIVSESECDRIARAARIALDALPAS